MNLVGSFVALVTPFTAEGTIDWLSFEELIEWHIQEGTDGLIIAGTTGEGVTLSAEEKQTLFKHAVAVARRRILIVAYTGTASTMATHQLTHTARVLGVDASLVMFPYANRPTLQGCIAHYEETAKAGLPIIAYHHPGRTGVRLSSSGLARILEIPGVVGLKEASGDMALATELVQMTDKPIFSGDDGLSLTHLVLGFKGVISIVGNLVPDRWKAYIDLALKGDFIAARARFFELYELTQAMVLETNPQCVKYALSVMGKCHPDLRLPLLIPEEKARVQIEKAITNVIRPSVV